MCLVKDELRKGRKIDEKSAKKRKKKKEQEQMETGWCWCWRVRQTALEASYFVSSTLAGLTQLQLFTRGVLQYILGRQFLSHYT